jgi:hypothetical protein
MLTPGYPLHSALARQPGQARVPFPKNLESMTTCAIERDNVDVNRRSGRETVNVEIPALLRSSMSPVVAFRTCSITQFSLNYIQYNSWLDVPVVPHSFREHTCMNNMLGYKATGEIGVDSHMATSRRIVQN